jgi:hypothetical protein
MKTDLRKGSYHSLVTKAGHQGCWEVESGQVGVCFKPERWLQHGHIHKVSVCPLSLGPWWVAVP